MDRNRIADWREVQGQHAFETRGSIARVTRIVRSSTIFVFLATGSIVGCSQQTTTSDAPPLPGLTTQEPTALGESGVRTDLHAVTVGAYTIQAHHLGTLSEGHINVNISGGDVKAVRSWIGDEAATNALVIKAEWEDTHYCADQEVPNPLPAYAKLWVEVETSTGELIQGGIDLRHARPLPE